MGKQYSSMSKRFWGVWRVLSLYVVSIIALGGAVRVLYSMQNICLLRHFDLLSDRLGNFERIDGVSGSESKRSTVFRKKGNKCSFTILCKESSVKNLLGLPVS